MKFGVRWLTRAVLVGAAAAPLVPGCIARGESPLVRLTDDDAGGAGTFSFDASAGDAKVDLPPVEPHAVLGVDPPHGPFKGGQLVIVRGNGFGSDVRVWFGGQEVSADDVVPIDPGRVQVVVPPGKAGPVEVRTQNGDDGSSSAALAGGYSYDLFYADPASGPTSGGTEVAIIGQGTQWADGTSVEIDLKPCEPVMVVSPTELRCTTPKNAPGVKSLRVTTPDSVIEDVLDAFTYGDSDNGFRGGLSGNPLNGTLKVLALDNYTGEVIENATVVAGDDLSSALVKKTDASGLALFQDASLAAKRSVTVAKKCYQPITFVDVPVDTVTVYLDAVLSPVCADEGDPPPTGGSPGLGSLISGEILWGNDPDKKNDWSNVPEPQGAGERRAAYVFALSPDPERKFALPDSGSAITPDSEGTVGYEYRLNAAPGNLTLYAVAGIENRNFNPPLFLAYAMGIAKGVSALPGVQTQQVFIPIDVPLDHALTVSISGPTPTAKGPDRVETNVVIKVGELGFALLPGGYKSTPLPVGSNQSFVGVPPLSGSLSGSEYLIQASAVTGSSGSSPRSVVGALAGTLSNQVYPVSGFVEIPLLTTPPANAAWDGQALAISQLPGGASVELSVYDIQSGGGLVSWTVAAPAGVKNVVLPDLDSLGPELGLKHGPVTITVNAAHIEDFVYGTLRYRQLGTRGWNAYARDVFYAQYF